LAANLPDLRRNETCPATGARLSKAGATLPDLGIGDSVGSNAAGKNRTAATLRSLAAWERTRARAKMQQDRNRTEILRTLMSNQIVHLARLNREGKVAEVMDKSQETVAEVPRNPAFRGYRFIFPFSELLRSINSGMGILSTQWHQERMPSRRNRVMIVSGPSRRKKMSNIQKLLSVVALGIASSVPAFAADPITIAGSTTVKPIVENAMQQFKKKNPGVEFAVGGGGSGQGIQLVSKGTVNIGMSSRPLNATEKTSDLVEHRIGLDGVTLIANKSNPVSNLTTEQVQGIYSGKITNWKELGGPAAPIVVYTLNSKHGTHEVFMEYFGLETKESGEGAATVAVHRKKGDEAYSTLPAKAMDEGRQVIAAILTNPNAIGYVSIGIAASIAGKGAPIRLLDLDGIAATEANVVAGTYKLSRPLLLLTKGEAKGAAQDFIHFLAGPEGQAIVKQMDYIPSGN
jgi:phosphate transport system substrate-binding protein